MNLILRRSFVKFFPLSALLPVCPLFNKSISGKTAAKDVRLFILSGQSNAGGNGNGEELSGEMLKTDPEVLIYTGDGRPWEEMAPKELRTPKKKFKINKLIFGAELSFAKELKKAFPDEIIAVCKVAVSGGTSIIAWEKNRERKGWLDDLKLVENEDKIFKEKGTKRYLYEELINETKKGIQLLKKRSDVGNIKISGMLWLQNERDGSYEKASRDYKNNLINLIHNVRTDLNAAEMPFMFFDSHIENKEEIRVVMKKGLREVVKEIPYTGLILNNDLPTYEGVHFTTRGIIELGKRFSAKYLEIINKSKK